MALELILEKSIFKGLKMKRIDYEQYLRDFSCVHGKEVKRAIYKFFEGDSEIKLFLDLVDVTKGTVQYDFFTLLLNRLDFRGYSLSEERLTFFNFQKVASFFFVWLFFVMREEYYDFFMKNNYSFLHDLL
jgi:hypothetical protein